MAGSMRVDGSINLRTQSARRRAESAEILIVGEQCLSACSADLCGLCVAKRFNYLACDAPSTIFETT